MAIDITTTRATAKAALKTGMSTAFGESEATYDTVAGVFVDAIVQAVLDEIKDNADLTGVTSGSDTVTGGVD